MKQCVNTETKGSHLNTNNKIVLAVLKRFRAHKTNFKYQLPGADQEFFKEGVGTSRGPGKVLISNALKCYSLNFGGSLTTKYQMRTVIFIHNILISSNTYFPISKVGVATSVTPLGSAIEYGSHESTVVLLNTNVYIAF